ncbi:MAG: RNA polymerase sigma factor RpoD/SigA [Holophagales bacterium]|nr:RNA polymerase sigma factor RpoD/SigA [Holophagales bacterium]
MTITPFSDNSLGKYFDSLGRFPRLTDEEVVTCSNKWHRDGDKEALNRLIEGNLRFVVKESKRYQNLGLELIDLISEGNLGLVEAAKSYKPDRNAKFTTYAILLIRQAIFRALADNGTKVKLPVKLAARLYHLQREIQRLEMQMERKPSIDEIAESTKMGRREVEELLYIHQTITFVSTDQNIAGSDISIGESLEQDVAQDALDEFEREAIIDKLKFWLARLSEKERRVLQLHYGIGGGEPMPLDKIGSTFDPPLTRESVRNIERRAIAKIRKNNSALGALRDYLSAGHDGSREPAGGYLHSMAKTAAPKEEAR